LAFEEVQEDWRKGINRNSAFVFTLL